MTPMARRPNGQGTAAVPHPRGGFVTRITLGSVDGYQVRRAFYGRTAKAAEEKRDKAIRARDGGTLSAGPRTTVAKFLGDWLEWTESQVRPKTYRHYEQTVRNHLIPQLGSRPLSSLTVGDVEAMMKRMALTGSRQVSHARSVLRNALNAARRHRILSDNVAALAKLPRLRRRERPILAPEHMTQLLRHIRQKRFEALWITVIAGGFRLGEALGLRWRDVDWESSVIRAENQLQDITGARELVETKTDGSQREVSMPEWALTFLRLHQAQQAERRLLAGASWRGADRREDDYVFGAGLGQPLMHRNVERAWTQTLKSAGLGHVRLHDLRHTYGSLLAAQGVHPRVIMDRLGHTALSTTTGYTHVIPELQREATRLLDSLLRAIAEGER